MLAAIQFVTVLDFLIVIPLGPTYVEVLKITSSQFGLIVSAYAVAAGITGVLAGFFLDYFDRKSALLVLFTGFAVGTLFCALAPTYHLLGAARALAGAFAGGTGALILAIVGDAVPEQRRGAAMGLVMSAFSVASTIGVPCGLYLKQLSDWHAPFYVLAGLAAVILPFCMWFFPPMRNHLARARESHPVTRVLSVWMERDHQMAFLLMAGLTCGGALIFPFIPTYMVKNAGMSEAHVPYIYLVSGICTFGSMNYIGRWSDRVGKPRVFWMVSLCAVAPVLIFTNLPPVPFVAGVAVCALFMVCMSGRQVPAMSMITGSVKSQYRGGFMSANSSVQQFSLGLATYVSGLITDSPTGELRHFPIVGFMSATLVLACIPLSRFLRPAVEDALVPQWMEKVSAEG